MDHRLSFESPARAMRVYVCSPLESRTSIGAHSSTNCQCHRYPLGGRNLCELRVHTVLAGGHDRMVAAWHKDPLPFDELFCDGTFCLRIHSFQCDDNFWSTFLGLGSPGSRPDNSHPLFCTSDAIGERQLKLPTLAFLAKYTSWISELPRS